MNRYSAIVLTFIVVFFSCKQKIAKEDTFSSIENLFVEYVSAYTNGFISSQSEIKVKLAKTIETAEPGKEIIIDLFSFVPSIKGEAYWEDNRTAVFKPNEKLKSGQNYNATFSLGKILETPVEKEEFRFTFSCIPQNFEVVIEGLSLYDAKNLEIVKITGILQTADIISNEEAEQIITAEQDRNTLQILFEHGVGQNRHNFTIDNVIRKEKKGNVKISWDGKSIQVDKKGDTEFEVPSLSDYTVTMVKLVRSDENYISVLFSDPIDDKQNLRGIVRLSQGTNPRVIVELNELKIYPTSRLTGSVQLTIDKSIKNVAGHSLNSDHITDLQFSQLKPEVKMATNSGVIMPTSEGLIVPFEAVSLSAVDLTIVRIFENNVLQYLQTNSPGRDYELRRVGRPIVRKTIPLNTTGVIDLNNWNRFTIDISDHVSVEKGAFYQVRLNFRKSYSLYFCVDSDNDITTEISDDWEFEESTNWDTYDDYYYYDWENRDNPCHKAYYTSDRLAKKIIFSSNLGILAKKADQGNVYVFVTDLITTKPIAGTRIEVYDFQQQLTGSGETDGDGKIEIEFEGRPFVLVARKDEQYGYLRIDDGTSLSLSNFNISGSKIQKSIKGFIYGERGVWRPGDTLHLSFILEDIQDRLPDSHPVILELYNPLGQLFSRTVQTASVNNLYTYQVTTPNDAPTGNWQAIIKVGGAVFNKQLKIETVKPNRLKISLNFDNVRLLTNQTQYGNLNVRWLHGAVARGLKATYEVLFVPIKTTFKGYENATFDDPSKEYYPEAKTIFEGRLNDEGFARLSFKIRIDENPPGMLNAIFRGKVFEEGGDFSIDKTTIPCVPYSSFVGIQIPEGDQRGMLVTDKDHNVRVVTVNSEGSPISKSSLNVEIYKLRWRWWWDNTWENASNYTSSYYSELIKSGKVATKDGEGIYKLRIDYPEWGRYFLKVTDPVSRHSSGKIFYIDWPGWAGKQKRGDLGGVTMLDFSVESEQVKVGENIRVNVPSSEGGRILVSLETGSKILDTYWAETEAENTQIEFDATSSMSPNIYVHITMLQPHAQTVNDLPIRMYGVKAIEVTDPETVLNPVINMPDELSPEKKFSVTINEANGKPMAYTIAVVEDGLLDLTKFKTPEPHKSFFAREALGVKTWDVFDDVIGSYGGQIERLLSIGGDEEIEGPDEKEANRFKPVIIFKGPFFLKPGEKSKHSFIMPQYIGSVRTMVVAGYNRKYGNSEKTVPVKQPLMILATLPRVAGPLEDIKLPVNVFRMDDNIRNVKLKVETSGKLRLSGTSEKSLTFIDSEDQLSYFDLKASPDLGVGKVKVTASSGNLSATYDVEIQIRPSNPEINQVHEGILEGGQNWSLAYVPMGLLGTNEGVVELSSLPPLNLEQRLKYLINYPHGCIEQTVSSVFAQLYLDDLITLDEKRADDIQKNINAAIERLRSFQLPSGAFSFWPGNSEANYWGTNYAGHFLIEARNQGYMVPEDIISSWITFQQEQANVWNKSNFNDFLTQTYRLYTLSLSGNPALGAMNRLRENRNISNRAKWSLASAYAIAGYDQVSIDLINGLSTNVDNYRELGGTYGSTQRDQAIILETLVRLNKQTDAFEMIRQISEIMSNGNRWMSTQSTAFCLIGIAEFVKQFPMGEDINVQISVAGKKLRIDSEKYLSQVTLIEPDKKADLQIVNNGQNPLFIRVIRTGVPLEGVEVKNESNIEMKVEYKDMRGNIVNVENISQGTDFVAEVTVKNPGFRGDYEEIAITQIFPSGWEIINTRLDDLDLYYQQNTPEYQDIRDDRVMTYFDLKKNSTATFRILLNASYQGKFYLPAVYVEAMYDNSIAANSTGRWIAISSE